MVVVRGRGGDSGAVVMAGVTTIGGGGGTWVRGDGGGAWSRG